jgi:hypothetical protein
MISAVDLGSSHRAMASAKEVDLLFRTYVAQNLPNGFLNFSGRGSVAFALESRARFLTKAGVLCTNCARIDRFQHIRVGFERKADSPICWKR